VPDTLVFVLEVDGLALALADDEEELDELEQAAAASPMHAMPSTAANRRPEGRKVSITRP
jgi:hypothetical protein